MSYVSSFTLTKEQKEKVQKEVEEIREKHKLYENVECVTEFDVGYLFEPTEDEMNELEEDK